MTLKNISKLLNEYIDWIPLESSKRDFITINYPTEICFLRMNNFPEEPLWTLFYHNESIDIEDTPEKWKIKYRSEDKG